MSETKTCPRCESANVSFHVPVGGSQACYTCENGHKWGAELAKPPSDPINPPHYTAGAIECIDAIMSAIDGMQAQHAICVGNVIKYLWRLHRKGDAKENARKAAWYLERLVRELG